MALLLLAMMGALGSMAIHMFVPALPAMALDLRARSSDIQLAITLYISALGLSQLVAGPAADRLGRKPVLLAGLALFTIGSLAGSLAGRIWIILLARLVQAAGGAAIIVAVRAIVADLSAHDELSANLSTLTAFVLLSPTLSPLAGAVLVDHGGWRAIFLVLVLAGLVAGAATLRMRETRPAGDGRPSPSFSRDLWRLARNGRFVGYVAALSSGSTGLYIFLGAGAFLLVDRWKLAPRDMALCFAAVAASGVWGSSLVRAAERRAGASTLGFGLSLAGASLMLALAIGGIDRPLALVGPMMVMAVGLGMANPATLARLMRVDLAVAGTAASLGGAIPMLVSGLAASMFASIGIGSHRDLALCLFTTSLLGFLALPRDIPRRADRPL